MLRMRWGKKASSLKRIIKIWNSCPRKWERVQTLGQQKDFQVTSRAVITLKPYMCKGAHHQSQSEYGERRGCGVDSEVEEEVSTSVEGPQRGNRCPSDR